MAQRKARTGRGTTKAKPARKRAVKRAAGGKAPRRATATAGTAAERRVIEALRAENRRLREEVEALRAERVAPAPTEEVPRLPLGDPSSDRV